MEPNGIAVESGGRAIDRLCREQGRKKGWVARAIGVRPDELSRLISGERPITDDLAGRLGGLFGVPADTFTGGRHG